MSVRSKRTAARGQDARGGSRVAAGRLAASLALLGLAGAWGLSQRAGAEAALVQLSLPPGELALGRAQAPLTMVEFTDYQCPYCRKFETEVWPQLKHDYIDTGKLRFIVRDLPLDIHASAGPASEAAHCAAEQGRFWEMHQALLTGPADFPAGGITRRAHALGLDLKRFDECVRAGRYAAVIETHVREANAAGIDGTPGFVVGRTVQGELQGIRFEGAPPYERLDGLLHELLAAAAGG